MGEQHTENLRPPESNQRASDRCKVLQPDALPTELQPACLLKTATDTSLFAGHSVQCHRSGRKRVRPPRPPHGTTRQREYAAMDNRTVDHGAIDSGTLELGEQVKRTIYNGIIVVGELGQESSGTMGHGTMGQWTSEPWSRGQWTMSQW